ncbi:SGNH/GDSL hydrolase family protein [Labrys sp. 22185]|uniref:SGNH/GDSL hydrolase family protein n=1 Tax=Labrys sp. 22185 TaxID=3453888 RepID=UPI003F83D611
MKQRLLLIALFVLAAVVLSQRHVLARDGGGETPGEALRQYQEMQNKVRQQNARPAPVRRTKVRASPFAMPKPAKVAPAPAVPPSSFVHVIGDSMADQLAAGLADVLDDRPDIAIIRNTKADSGLVRNDFYDWNKGIADLLAANAQIDAVVILIGSNDRQTIRENGTRLEPQSDEWEAAYRKRIDTLIAPLKARGVKIFWVGLPPMRSDTLSAAMVRFNSLYRSQVTAAGGIYVDIWDGFVNSDGSYAASGTGLDGQPARLRKADGVHFSDEGAKLAAHFLESDLRRLLGEAPPAPMVATAPVAEPTSETPGDSQAEKPEYGPVLPLDAYETTPGGQLLGGGAPKPSGADPSVAKVLGQGESLPPREGRADDFRWPSQVGTP